MIILGYALAVLMGLTLGLIGAGGSILTVPILVYFFKIPPLVATAYSLLIVGATALIGAFFYHKKSLVNVKSAIIFALPATISVFCTRSFVIPHLPEEILQIPKEIFVMLLFSLLMLVAAFFMMRPIAIENIDKKPRLCRVCFLIIGSAAIGFLTGMVGAGGGFLIIPALVILFNLPMKEAIGTSLGIIATNSLVGFNGDLASGLKVNWIILGSFIFFTTCGMFLGLALSEKFDGQKLKRIFASFILVVAVSIFINEINAVLTIYQTKNLYSHSFFVTPSS